METLSAPAIPSQVAATTRYYSMRRLSPYQGTIQIVELPGFRAMSADGYSWEIRVDNIGMRPTRAVWREDALPDDATHERVEPFLDHIRRRPPLPFALADMLELWLLDARDGLPLALLASTLPHIATPSTVDTHWRAAFSGDDCFISPSLQATAASPVEQPFIPHREILNRCVRRAAGARPRAQWFRRGPTGDGLGLNGSGIDTALLGRKVEAPWFPELLLREEWDSDVETGLVRDYHCWLAPALLTHSNLRAATRDRLEHAAGAQTEKLYRVRHLLPEIVNRDLVEVALVEAVLRRASSTPAT